MTVLVNDWHDWAQENPPSDVRAAAASPAVLLTIIDGCGEGHAWEICGHDASIGRGARNDVVLDFGDLTIHRDRHAAIEIDGDIVRVRDVRRGNPIFVNEEVVDGACDVSMGDRIRIGMTTLRLDPA